MWLLQLINEEMYGLLNCAIANDLDDLQSHLKINARY